MALLPLMSHGLDPFVKLLEGCPEQLQIAISLDKKEKSASFENPQTARIWGKLSIFQRLFTEYLNRHLGHIVYIHISNYMTMN